MARAFSKFNKPLSLFRADGPPPDVPVGPPLMAGVMH